MIRLVPLCTLLSLAACGRASNATAPTSPTTQFTRAHQAVCDSATAAGHGNANRARTVFLNGAHQQIHELAAAVTTRDRPTAGRLLEANERVEHDFATNAAAATVADDLDTLGERVRAAIAATGAPRPRPCTTVGP